MGKQIQKKAKPEAVQTRRERVSQLLEQIERGLANDAIKPTVADFIRLTELERELESEEQPREIKVTWVAMAETSDIEK